MKKIVFLASISLMLFLSSQGITDDQEIDFAKSLTAKEYDRSLPSVPIEQWLIEILPKNIIIEWAKYITDCGEQTGNLELDKNHDMPLCAEVELKENKKRVGSLLLFIGTKNKGIRKKEACLYDGYIYFNNKQVTLKMLSELKKIK